MAHDIFNRRHEIIVAGGSLCGFAAAMAARRSGRQVLLVDRRATIGWEITWAFQNRLLDNAALADWRKSKPTAHAKAAGNAVPAMAAELYGRLEAIGAARDGLVSPAAAELELFQMLEEAGVELLLGAVPLAPVAEEKQLCGLLVGGKSGQHLLTCDMLIDATDNLLLSREIGLTVVPAASVSGQLSIMLNCLPEVPVEPLHFGRIGAAADVTVTPCVFTGEARLSLTVDNQDLIAAYLAVPEVLTALRRHPSLQLALVTAIGPELMPTAATHRLAGGPDASARPDEFLPAHPGAIDGAANDPAGRLAIGTQVGQRAALAWKASAVCTRASVGSLLPKSPRETVDVVVAGGGTAGPLAAIAAARQGAKVVLLETMTYLGGMATGGGIHTYYHGVTGGLQDEVDARVAQLSPMFVGDAEIIGRSSQGLLAGFHPDAKKIALLQLATDAGVMLRFDSTMTGAMTEPLKNDAADDRAVARRHPARPVKGPVRVTAALAADPGGMHIYAGKAFIDCTGDGDLAAMAGAEFIMGREGDGLLHAFSQSCGRLVPIDDAGFADPQKPATTPARPRMAIVNFDAGFCDPDDITDLTRARQLGLSHLRRDRWTDEERWTYIAPHLGLRQGRHIVGDYQLTLSDEISGQTFPDVIAYAQSHYDNHAHDVENESDAVIVWTWLLGQWRTPYGCEIPYRCLLPKGVEGLLVACRALAVTVDAHHQLRMQRDMQRIGEAAGIAAAIAARFSVSPRDVNIAAVQAELRKVGALNESQRPKPAIIEQPPQQLVEAALSGDFNGIWQVGFQHAEVMPAVRAKVESNLPAERFWSAIMLAMAGDGTGAPELRATVAEQIGRAHV